MEPSSDIRELTLTLRLSRAARERLEANAAQSGRNVATIASDLIEGAVRSTRITEETLNEMLRPYRDQVPDTGMSDEQLDDFHRQLIEKVRQEKRAKSA